MQLRALSGGPRVWYTGSVDLKTWTTLSRLIDEALELPPAARTTWLDGLAAEYEAFKPRLREMLDQAAHSGDAAFLDTLPKLRDAALGTGDDGPAPGPERAGTMVGPYRLVRELASGGQGSVWLAERPDGLVNRPVAIKLPLGLVYRIDLADRMARERDILASLTHPHIARLYDAGVTAAGEPFLALEYVEGTSIDRYCDHHRLDIDARLRLFLQVARAVAYAHGQLVIHRDLKPSNVLVTSDGDVRLLDFGIAKLLDAREPALTEAGTRAMTLQYASPEQVSSAPLGVRTDVYSLGVMLYELLTGRQPYRPARATVAALEEAILSGDPVRPSQAAEAGTTRRGLAGDLDAVVLKALKKAPDDRYPTVDAFGEDIERHLDHRPVVAQPDSCWYRGRKFVVRNRWPVGAAAAIVVAVLAGAGTAVWQARVARTEQRRAEAALQRAEAVTGFIASIFKEVDPNLRGQDRPVTAFDVLNRARDRVNTQLGGAPDARAELMRILGDSLLGIGAFDSGADVLRTALGDSERLHGPDAPETIEAGLLLAAARQYDAGSNDALDQIDRVIASLTRSNQLDSEAFVRAKVLRVAVMLNRGNAGTPEAKVAGLEALDAATRILPPSHRLFGDAFEALSTIYRTQGKPALSLEYAERGYNAALSAHHHDPRHPKVVDTQNVYGRALFEMDRTAEAVAHLKQAVANGEEVYKENGLYVQHLLGTLANIQETYGEIKEALANLKKASAADIGHAALSDTYVASQSAVLARVYLAARHPAEALPLYQRAVDGFRKAGSARTAQTFDVERAAALVALGRIQEARAIAGPMVDPRPAQLNNISRQALLQLAIIEQRQGRPDRALDLLRDAEDPDLPNPRSRVNAARVRLQRARIFLDRRQVEDAFDELTRAKTVLETVEGVTTPLKADILICLGRVRLAQGRAPDAVASFEEAHAFWQAFDPTHADAREAASWLARARAER